jgi:hypothetical protein
MVNKKLSDQFYCARTSEWDSKPQKIVLKVGVSFDGEKRVSKNQRNTTNSPQKHHQKPSQKHPFFSKPPVKTPLTGALQKNGNHYCGGV